jgi:SAM-dependent methyltransferase
MIVQQNEAQKIKAQSAAGRGERLYPPASSRVYWILTELRRTIQLIIDNIFADIRNVTLIDYGCGNMPYRPLFQPHVAEYIPCDFPGNELASHFIEPDGSLPFADGIGTVVLSTQVLEHVSDPAHYLREAYRVLSPGGTLLLSTHGIWRYHPDPCDYWRWTCDGLRTIVEREGFTIIDFRGVMGPAATGLQIWQDARLTQVPVFLRPVFLRFTQWRIKRADLRCPAETRNHDACVFVLVATKPSNSIGTNADD